MTEKTTTVSISMLRSFVGKHADDLGNLISEQIKPIYQSLGIIVPVKSCSVIHALYAVKHASLTDLAKTLNQSHQLIKQKLPRLLKEALITVEQDVNDKRRTLYALTDLGIKQAQLLNDNPIEQVYNNLSQDVGADISQVLVAAIAGLKSKPMLDRFNEQTRQNTNQSL